jgi:hypothetical protein
MSSGFKWSGRDGFIGAKDRPFNFERPTLSTLDSLSNISIDFSVESSLDNLVGEEFLGSLLVDDF